MSATVADPLAVVIDYCNHRGERRERLVRPTWLYFGSTEWHHEEQWLLVAYDFEKRAVRTFAMKDVRGWHPASILAKREALLALGWRCAVNQTHRYWTSPGPIGGGAVHTEPGVFRFAEAQPPPPPPQAQTVALPLVGEGGTPP